MKIKKKCSFCVLAGLFTLLGVAVLAPALVHPAPGEWPISSPEARGMDPAILADMLEHVQPADHFKRRNPRVSVGNHLVVQ